MENRLDVLTKKLYDEGIEKARQEADEIVAKARQEAEKLVADAETEARKIKDEAAAESENLKKKAESEMTLSARQAITALKQAITGLISGKVAGEMVKGGFEDKMFVRELLISIVKKWDVASGNLNLELVLPESEKKDFDNFIASRYKDLLDKGLEVKAGTQKEAFIIRPKDGGYQISFSEALFEAFFGQYMRNYTKALLYN